MSYESIETFDQHTDDVILLKIISYDGRLVSLCLLATQTIREVKIQAISELLLPINSDVHYKLLKPSETMDELSETLSIRQSKLSDYGKSIRNCSWCIVSYIAEFYRILPDELLLLKCDNIEDVRRKNIQKGPSQEKIDKITVERVACGEKIQPIADVNEIMLRCDVISMTDNDDDKTLKSIHFQVQNDIRHLLVSLAKSSAFVIGASSFATQIIFMFKERLIRRNGNDLYRMESIPQLSVQEKLKKDG